jgi:hypothetical protein
LKDFNYKLAMALINSLADPYFQNVLIANPNRAAAKENNEVTMDNQLGIVQDPATLAQRIQVEKWPKKHCYCGFTNWRNLMALWLTENDEFEHTISKMNPKKLHCALCIVHQWENNVSLLDLQSCTLQNMKDKSHKHQSCFMIWHNHIDLIIEHHKIRHL